MEWWSKVAEYLKNLGIYSTTIRIGDVLEILIIAFLLYYLLKWTKGTRAWSLLKGVIVIAAFLIVAFLLNMDTILWIAKNIINYAVFAILIILQPELRKGLENLGRKNMLANFLTTGVHHSESREGISSNTIAEIVKACTEMGKARTGALIVIRNKESLSEYESTGISLDAIVTSALLINIFEKNTPLHDGAVVIVGNRVTSATCYLPLSDSLDISKDLGTRHRAAMGVSESTDSVTVVVSEETGHISVTYDGVLETISGGEQLKNKLTTLLMGDSEKKGKIKNSRIISSKKKNKKSGKKNGGNPGKEQKNSEASGAASGTASGAASGTASGAASGTASGTASAVTSGAATSGASASAAEKKGAAHEED